jgi:hypothetical protein
MKLIKRVLVVMIILSAFSGTVFADGGGGFFFAQQMDSFPFLEQVDIPFKNNALQISGGYGYGVSRNGAINGGFGYGMYNEDGSIGGGFGGVVSGHRFTAYPLTIQLLSLTGVGGIGIETYFEDYGYFAVMQSFVLEIGLPLTRWFMPIVYFEYQFIGNIMPGNIFSTFTNYTPVAGMRFAWGDFY